MCLGVFKMDTKHTKNRRDIEGVEESWSEKESKDTINQIANALSQMESSEFLEHCLNFT